MAAVVINVAPPLAPLEKHVVGDLVCKFFNISGATGSTLNTNMSGLVFVTNQQSTGAGTISLITAMSVNIGTGVITFTSSGSMVNEIIMVMGRVG